jgi:cardiolipin synthase
MSLRWLPNAITVGRMVLALPLLWALATGRFALGFWLAVVAGASDAVDGYLAKRFAWNSQAGGLLDPVADKLLLSAGFLGLWWAGQLPPWLVVLVIGRDLVILGGAAVWWRTLGPFVAEPSRLSKLNTVVQIALVAVMLFDAAFAGQFPAGAGRLPSAADPAGPLPLVWVYALVLACTAFTVASGVDYVLRWGARYRIALRNRP